MANQEYLDVLAQGAEAWNSFREQNREIIFGADLSEASLPDVNLSGATLSKADLSGAIAAEANFGGANFSEANLSFAQLNYGTYLSGANFSGANLSGADFREAQGLTRAQLEQAFGDENTILPAGIERPESWIQSQGEQTDEN